MSEYVLSCCSTADLSREHFDRRSISYVCAPYYLNGEARKDDLGQTMSMAEFYEAMRQGAETRTSQVGLGDYLEYFSALLEQGKDVLHIALSSGLSGTVQSARSAAQMAQEQYPDRKIYVVDSLAASSGFGLLMDRLADLRDEGKTMEEVRDWVEAHKKRVNHWFFSTDLTFFVRGGRISKAAGAVGGMLNLCPLMSVSHEGKLVVRKKCIGKKKVLSEILARMVESAEDRTDYSGKCYICNSDCIEDAKTLAASVEATFPKLNGKVEIYDIGTTIGSHTGPGTVALFFWGDERVN